MTKKCMACGHILNPQAKFCTSCGRASTPIKQKKPVFLYVFALILIIGSLFPFLSAIAGQNTTGVITEVRRDHSNSEQDDHSYRVRYSFTVNNERFTGSYTMNRVYDYRDLPRVDAHIPVRYVPFMPSINSHQGVGGGILTGLLFLAIGGVLLFFAIKGR